MNYEKLKSAAETITLSDEMKQRIIQNCKAQIAESGKETFMKNRNTFRRPAAVLAALAVCLSLTVTALAANGVMTGFFVDIRNWQGAVVDTAYEQATDEINIRATVDNNELTVLAVFADAEKIPYRYAEKLGIGAYRIMDAKGSVVQEGMAESVGIFEGRAAFRISVADIASGSYKLMITSFISEKKADQPLTLNGTWVCDFNR